eukprot:5909685-Prymnesium_polylepis.1
MTKQHAKERGHLEHEVCGPFPHRRTSAFVPPERTHEAARLSVLCDGPAGMLAHWRLPNQGTCAALSRRRLHGGDRREPAP